MDIRSFFSAKGGSAKPAKGASEANNNAKQSVIKETPTKPSKKTKTPDKKKSPKAKANQKDTKSKRKPSYDDDKVDIVSSDDDFTNIKNKSKEAKSSKDKSGDTKKKRAKLRSESPEEVKIEEEEDESPIKSKKRSKAKAPIQVLSSEDEEEKSTKKKSKKAKKGAIIYDSGSDNEDPIPSSARKSRKRKSRHSFMSDSDNEQQVSIEDAFKKVHKKPEVQQLSNEVKTTQKKSPEKKQISAADFFGMGAVKRTEKKDTPSKRKMKEEPVDTEMHDDEDFEKTLADLDDKQPAKKQKRESTPPKKANGSSTLASKLAAAKAENKPETKTSPVKTVNNKTPSKISPKKETSPVKPTESVTKGSKVTPEKGSKVKLEKQSIVTPEKEKSPREKAASGTPGELQRRPSGFRAYLNREGPKALGSKEIPEGAENCLEGLTFVLTGVLESMERDETKVLIERHGGKVTGNLSKKTSYVVAGRDAGESKMAKARQFGTKELDEDGLLDLIRTLPGKKSKYQVDFEKQQAKEKTLERKMSESKATTTPGKATSSEKLSSFSRTPDRKMQSGSVSNTPKSVMSQDSQSSQQIASPQVSATSGEVTLMWVDKYKPTQLKQIIGQQGDKSNARKLLHWLKHWHKNRALGKKPAFNRFNDDGSGHKAALLSGPPGVGKTTTATLVCEEAGFSFVELNASDTRSKKSLQTEVAEALGNHTLVDYFGDTAGSGEPDGRSHCLVMDEVDGMAGNQDRGGMQELISLIKSSKIPIICMCNDRNSQKVRSLANYCFDLRFQRPRLEQIKSAMMSIAYKEGLKIPPPALNEIISAANQDVRQVLHNLSMWTAGEKNLSFEQAKADANKAKKDLKLGPFDVCRKVFVGGEETSHMTLNDKSDLFFHDYSFGPLFVQENYIHVTPYAAKGRVSKHLELLSEAADSLAQGDLVDKQVRGRGKWNLLPLQAMFASVLPGESMRGSMHGMIQFPAWLGKNSSTGKTDRILQELKSHMRLKLFCDKSGLNTDYLPHFRRQLTEPLVHRGAEGVPDVVSLMNDYDLQREDFDNILELAGWATGGKDPMSKVESKTKAAFTRAYNKEAHLTPYSLTSTVKKGKRKGGGADLGDEMSGDMEGEEVTAAGSSEEEDDPLTDGMIKAKKKPAAKKAADTKKATTSAKGKGGGKGGGKGKKK